MNPWVLSEKPKEKTHKIAYHVGCPTENHKELLKCLRKVPAEDIVRSVQLFLPFLYSPFTTFGPVIEKESNDAFLSEYPSVLLKSKKIQKLPWLATTTQNEGLYPAAEFYDVNHLKTIYEKWNSLAPFLLDFNGSLTDENEKLKVSAKVKDFYLGDEKPFKDEINDKFFFGLRNVSLYLSKMYFLIIQ